MNNTTKQTILIVDDNPTNIHDLAVGLKKEYRIKIATNGEKALEIVKSSDPPDIVLLDVMMPVMDGYAVCSLIKADERTGAIPVIFITSKDNSEDELQGLAQGAVDYISKPFNFSVVMARVQTHLELKRKNDLLQELAMLDGLTEIPNRRSFDNSLEMEWRRSQRAERPLALIMADVDHFKRYNDRYGHTSGDKCLRQVAQAVDGHLYAAIPGAG
jgi:PleD family two-component response regulator